MESTVNYSSLSFNQKQLDHLIVLSMLILIPVDLVHGYLHNSGISFMFSIAQVYKLYFLGLLLFSLSKKLTGLILIVFFVLLLFLPSIWVVISKFELQHLGPDLIKVFRYMTCMISFLYLKDFIQRRGNYAIRKLIQVLYFSYILIAISIFLKYIGLGFPMYQFGNLGSKGLFSAGNEVSVLMLIVSSIVAFHIWKEKKVLYYALFFIFNLALGLAIGSKTASIGSLILLSLIPLHRPSLRFNFKRFIKISLLIVTAVPIIIYFSWQFITSSDLYIRIFYFYNKFDFYTFFLSNRNIFLQEAFQVYLHQYSLVEKLIGVGETNYYFLNDETTVESDVFDIFFAYGVIGLISFILLITWVYVQFKRFGRNIKKYPYANFGFLMLVFLILISTLAGHTFSSGMAAPFIGLALALPYFKKENDANSIS